MRELTFHQRTALNVAARNRANQTSNSQNMAPNNADVKADPFAQHDATDAANGLFMLAKGGQAANQFAVPNQPSQTVQTKDSKRNTRTSNGTVNNGDSGDGVDSPEDNSRPNTRGGRSKKNVKPETTANNRRKAESTPKGGNKRSKSNSGNANVDPALQDDDDDDDDDGSDEEQTPQHQDGKKMTDEEKRRNFLERNR